MSFPNLAGATLVSKGTLYGRHGYQAEVKTSLNPTGSWSYDTAAVLGADAVKYNLARIEVDVFVLDADAGSPTNGYYVPAGAVAAYGFKEDGHVTVVNQHTAAQDFFIRVFVSLKEV